MSIAFACGEAIIPSMEQFIRHSCDHEQIHYLAGYASQKERKANWLRTTKCRQCFVADKQLVQADATIADDAAIAHLNLPALVGSERQTTWAATIRAKRPAAMLPLVSSATSDQSAWLLISDAKWWIDRRDLSDVDLIQQAKMASAQAA
jgi:hypothetical protein